MIRIFDILFALIGLTLGAPVLLLITILGWFETRSPLYFQERVGRFQRPFTLVKFRTMTPGTASVATHLADCSSITKVGAVLRRTKLDELPQLWNVLKGEMSIVGPRPCLYCQDELRDEREKRGVFSVRPGITGLAQVNGLDMSEPVLLAQVDQQMIEDFDLKRYFKLIGLTITGKGTGDRVVRNDQGGRNDRVVRNDHIVRNDRGVRKNSSHL